MAAYSGPIIDVDLHHRPRTDDEFFQYLPAKWRALAEAWGRTHAVRDNVPTSTAAAFMPDGSRRVDAFIEPGVKPGYSFEMARQQLLDRYNMVGALSTHDVGAWPSALNPYYVREICSAVNQWMVEVWISNDARLRGVIVVPWGEPEAAVQEVRRAAQNSRMAGVLFASNPLARPLGDPLYHPVFAVAEELGLPIVVHVHPSYPTSPALGTVPVTAVEMGVVIPGQGQHYISSLVTHGVFEKYPGLRILFNEYGVAWLPSLLWRLDEEYDVLKLESPWVKRWPSEYIREHVLLSTQPLEDSASSSGDVVEVLATIEGIEDMLCFASDYPHAAMDDPDYIARVLPKAWHRKVFCDNAAGLLGFEVAPEVDQALALAE